MDTRLKHRLVGTAVIVALAVIFLPELLRPVADRDPVVESMDLPPRPVHSYEPSAGEPLIPPSPPEPTASSRISVQEPPAPELESEPRASLEVSPSAPPNEAIEEPRATARVADSGAEPVEGDAVPELSASLQAWVVQVGSFAEERNADALRDRLRAADFTAFVETAQIGERKMYRVRVGPELEKRVAERLKEEIQAKLQIAGQLRRYP